MLSSHLNANEGALKSNGSTVPIDVGISRSKPLFRASFGSFRALNVDFCGQLRSFREDRYAIPQNLRETAYDRHWIGLSLVLFPIGQLTDPQLSHQRRVPRQNSKVTIRARQSGFDGAHTEQLPHRRHDHQFKGFGKHASYTPAFIFSAFCKASSIVPTM